MPTGQNLLEAVSGRTRRNSSRCTLAVSAHRADRHSTHRHEIDERSGSEMRGTTPCTPIRGLDVNSKGRCAKAYLSSGRFRRPLNSGVELLQLDSEF